jgi:hypothetical protein
VVVAILERTGGSGSTSIAYLRFDERPVPEFTVVDRIPYDQKLEVTPYPAGDPNRCETWVVNARWRGSLIFQMPA